MDLLTALLNQGGGAPVRQLARSFGLDDGQTVAAITGLLPALGQGLARNASTPGGAEGLMAALAGGGHERYLEDPSTLDREETVRDGNGILGHILGSKEASRQVASQAAEQTGIGADVLKKMLPVVAAMAMGTLSRQSRATAAALPDSPAPGGLMGMLASSWTATGTARSSTTSWGWRRAF